MFALSGICIFVSGGSVKICQSVSVSREMGRNPVQDDPDLVAVHIVDKITEIFRSSVTGSGCIISCHLISPGTVKGMFCDTHQFHMGISHFLHIVRQCVGQFPIVIESFILFVFPGMFFPGTRMDLVNSHGVFFHVELLPFLHPCGVGPFVVSNIHYFGSRAGTKFRTIGIRIRLVKLFSFIGGDTEFIEIPYPHFWNKELINPHIIVTAHHICFRIPVVKISYYRNALCVGSPHCEENSLFFSLRSGMGSQKLIDFIMCSLSEKIPVQFRYFHIVSHKNLPLLC